VSAVYKVVESGTGPVTLEEARAYLKLSEEQVDDVVLSAILEGATEAAESYTRRSFRENEVELTLDEFCERIELRRDPIKTVDSVTRLVSGVATAVSASVYYLKRGVQTSEVLLADGEEWPDDADDREAAIVVAFTTGIHERVATAKLGILRLAAWLHENRGDCSDLSAVGFGDTVSTDAIKASGAHSFLDRLRVSRV